MAAVAVGLVLAASNGPGMRGVPGDGRAFGDLELLVLVGFVIGVLWLVNRGFRFREGPKGRPFRTPARPGGRRGSPASRRGAPPDGPR